jgi:hypothetical protein
MTEELVDSANTGTQPEAPGVDPLDAALSAAMSSFDENQEEEKKEEPEVAESSEEESQDDVSNEEAEAEESDEEEEVDASAPEHWPAEDKELFDKIKDPEARELALQIDKKLQAAHTRRSQEVSDQVRTAESFKKSFEPFQDELRREGLTEVQAVDALIREYQNTKQFVANLQQNPKAVIADLAKQYNVTVENLNDEDEYKDPYVAKLEQEIAELKGQVNNVTTGFQQQSQQENLNKIEAFKGATNEDGSLKHPHFERLRPAMADFVIRYPDADLGTAYEAAMRADPDLYKEVLDREVQSKLSKEKEKRLHNESLKKAQKAKRSLNGHGSASKAPKPIKTIDDALSAAVNQLSGR